MSILNGPRLNFWGGISTDVSVPNNSPTLPNGIETSLDLFDLTTSTVAEQARTYSDDQLYELINAPDPRIGPNSRYTAGGWNHYGEHVVTLHNALISSQGTPGNIALEGDMVGQPVYLLGSVTPGTGQGPYSGPMMVDLDPTATTTTQIFVGGLQIGNSSNPQLLIRWNAVCSSFDVNTRVLEPRSMDAPGSFHGSGTFQLTFPLSSIVSYNKDSAGLKALIEAPNASGIVLRFVMFEMCPTLTTDQLNADYAANQFSPNPSIGRVIGTLATAYADEPQICPPGRQIINADQDLNITSVAYAEVANGQLSIDMVNLIPKQRFRAVRDDITSPIGPNADYGTVTVAAGETALASFEPSAPILQDYYRYGGIVDVPLDTAQTQLVQSTPLCISAPGNARNPALSAPECPYRVYSDQRNSYFDPNNSGVQITLQARYLGAPVPTDTPISIAASATSVYEATRYWDFLEFPTALTVPAGQPSVSFNVVPVAGSSGQAGFTTLNYNLGSHPLSQSFSNFRKYAQTDFGIPAGSLITWEQAYQNVLRFHYLAFPAMSRYIQLNQPDAVMGYKQAILARISPEYHNTTLYMSVVRSMSPSQRELLAAYLNGTPWRP
ncbi:hypothetical protein [Pseudomonas sp. Au-Pse12]|uniref:hypothetical protein n=1 Tax=Pseudomonas sp. Au-Pse12 TaxID=2906459 RepID=UPI001E50A66C|nr:hypothetical protein [Pseudomonas sp. Au-Pse12]MCE4056521.1 hypothetical protein [Pseudomonas sp. Au-Pse12]